MSADLIMTLAAATVGGLAFGKLKIPAGVLIGAIFAATLLSVGTGHAEAPGYLKFCAQVITGSYIATGITKKDLLHLPFVIKPFLVVMLALFGLNMVMGYIIYLISPLDPLTAMLCAMPGGMSDTPLIAMEMGADVPKVVVMQFVRMTFGIAVIPLIVAYADRAYRKKHNLAAAQAAAPPPRRQSGGKGGFFPAAATLAVGTAAGWFGMRLGITAGALVMSMAAVVAFKMLYPEASFPIWIRRVAQILSGSVIGCRIKHDDIIELKYLLLPALLLVAGYVINCFATGLLLHRLFKMDRVQAMLSASPAGATEMALIASELGVTSPDLIVLQLCRLISVLAIFPSVISVVVTFF